MRINTGYIKVGNTAKRLMKEILRTSRVSCGKYVAYFEELYAKKHNRKYAITVGSGTEADLIALIALKEQGILKDGDKVICPAICFISVANAILLAGLEPVFIDTDPFNMDLKKMADRIKAGDIKAILAVHFGGLPLDMDRLEGIAGGIPIIEDCACAHGSIANNEITGSNGILSTWSLYVAHIVSAGGGGVIGTDDDKLAELIYSMRAYGRSCTCQPCITNTTGDRCVKRFKNGKDTRFLYNRIGLNSRMTEMEAAIGIDQMEIYDEIIQKRLENYMALKEALIIPIAKRIIQTFPHVKSPEFQVSPIFFPIILSDSIRRSRVTEYLESKGIETRSLYACIPTQQYAYVNHRQSKDKFSNAELVGKKGFYVGIHQGLSCEDIEYLAEQITLGLTEGLK